MLNHHDRLTSPGGQWSIKRGALRVIWNRYPALPGSEPHRLWDSGAGSGRSGVGSGRGGERPADEAGGKAELAPRRDEDISLGTSLRSLETEYRAAAADRYIAPADDAGPRDDPTGRAEEGAPGARPAGDGAGSATAPGLPPARRGFAGRNPHERRAAHRRPQSSPATAPTRPSHTAVAEQAPPGDAAPDAPTAKAPDAPALRDTQEGGRTIDAKPLNAGRQALRAHQPVRPDREARAAAEVKAAAEAAAARRPSRSARASASSARSSPRGSRPAGATSSRSRSSRSS